MESLKNDTNELNRNRITDIENKFMVTKGGKRGNGQIRSLKLTDTHYYT